MSHETFKATGSRYDQINDVLQRISRTCLLPNRDSSSWELIQIAGRGFKGDFTSEANVIGRSFSVSNRLFQYASSSTVWWSLQEFPQILMLLINASNISVLTLLTLWHCLARQINKSSGAFQKIKKRCCMYQTFSWWRFHRGKPRVSWRRCTTSISVQQACLWQNLPNT